MWLLILKDRKKKESHLRREVRILFPNLLDSTNSWTLSEDIRINVYAGAFNI